jgi:hypothetical protein
LAEATFPPDQGMAEDQKPELSMQLIGNISNAELDRAELRTHASLNLSQPEGIEYAFCLSSGVKLLDG